jgi:hypothetical protein
MYSMFRIRRTNFQGVILWVALSKTMLSTYALLSTVTQLSANYCRYTVISENCEICLHISHCVKKNKSTCQIAPQEKVGHCFLTYRITRVQLHLTTKAAIQSCPTVCTAKECASDNSTKERHKSFSYVTELC